MKLYDYYRSSCAYRLRIALNLKKLDAELIPVNLLKAENFSEDYRKINPNSSVPTLVDGNVSIYQSLAALEYLEETHPTPPLLPKEPSARAHVRSIALRIACDIHPLNNIAVLRYLTDTLGISEEQKNAWYKHWIEERFIALQKILGKDGFCYGDSPTMADICLIPQVYNALRFECNMQPMGRIMSIYDHCMTLPVFDKASPDNQPNAA